MKKRIRTIGIIIISLVLTILIMRFYILPMPVVLEYLLGIFLVILFSASLIYWIYYGFRKYILRKREKEFDVKKHLENIVKKRSARG
ncbi:hypothetical protein ACFLX1_00780 [Chloroflexota bacterium]